MTIANSRHEIRQILSHHSLNFYPAEFIGRVRSMSSVDAVLMLLFPAKTITRDV